MKVDRRVVQMRTPKREIGGRHRGLTLRFVEEPSVDFSFQGAEMCDRSRTFMKIPG